MGTTLRGKWKLDALLGLGGMAAVYAATHRNGMRGAVKLLDPVLGRNEHMRERFLREGYLANSVSHPGAVLVLDDDTTEDGAVYLVMELLDGSTLEDLAANTGGTLPAKELMEAMAQLLDALAHAHARGIVHRDIKPDNLFATTEGTLKVLDFGIARLLESEMALSTTQTGSPMGTPAFMSPEQARGRAKMVDAQSDIYSVGATMFTLLSGQLVHGGDITISEYVAAAFTTQARPLASVAPDVPAPIAAVVDRALRLEKSERWPSAAEMLIALRAAFLTAYGEELPAPPPPSVRVSRPSLISSREHSLTPVSTPSRPPKNDGETVPPPPMASQPPLPVPSRARWVALAGVIGVAIVASLVTARVLHRDAPTNAPRNMNANAPTSTAEHVIPVEVKNVPAPPTVAEPTAQQAATQQKTAEHATPSPINAKPATKGAAKPPATQSAAPSASAPPAPTVDVYDRRY